MFSWEHLAVMDADQQWPRSGFMTTAEAADRLGYTVQHARRLIQSSKLYGRKVGRDWLVALESVESLVARSEYLVLPFEQTDEQPKGGR
jgi:excisionase family DNA binding protein